MKTPEKINFQSKLVSNWYPNISNYGYKLLDSFNSNNFDTKNFCTKYSGSFNSQNEIKYITDDEFLDWPLIVYDSPFLEHIDFVGPNIESETEFKTESETETKTESTTESEAESKTESDTESKTEFKTDSETESKKEPKTDSETESKAESKADSETESKTDSESGVEYKFGYTFIINIYLVILLQLFLV